ncbi:hypothetical protein KL914_002720 [Ogataea haglerorum]|uniref:non-specific serine/threonine protein kinase n=1 Tax=Ogataea haglerorum TaxID=1937702 RepID=A0ABQ7RIA9_9ASCO|nr:hypothetical protein KL914_002720 [Ogataea haglerorum]KAG7766087.1 hypothetical protein KL946_002267 [Ogataea haglerorum]KAG7810001.1 hypothetical protein KL924_002269 [Ogataea haglerorum]
MTSVAPQRVSSFASKAAVAATGHGNSNRALAGSERQIDRVVESVANANKRLSQTSTTSNSKRKAENRIGPWKLGRTLGRGSTGRVRLAKHCVTGQLSAVKIVPKAASGTVMHYKNGKGPKIDTNGLPYGIEREIIIMKLISHPNIMALYDVWENDNELYLVLEYVEGGELFDFLINHGRLTEQEAVGYFKQIIKAVEYCHKFDICHRDLKPENILLDKNHNIKIADFGMAALETKHKLLETSCGSPHYASPEIVAGRTYHGSPSDVWSCGIIFFALLTGHLPFDDSNIRKLLLKVQAGKFHMPVNLSSEAKDLIWSMLRVDPRDRISIHDILNHPLLKKYPDTSDEIHIAQEADLKMTKPIINIDPDILHNLQTLWHGIPINELVRNLQSQEQNSEKMFYYLLEKYKECHAQDSDEEQIHSKTWKRPPSPAKSAKLGIPKSTSIRTIIQDEHGEVLKMSTREIPSTANKAPPMRGVRTTTINKSKAPAMIVSSSSRKSVSFPRHSSQKLLKDESKPCHSKSLAKSKKLTVNPKDLPKLPEVDLSDFTYLVDAVFTEEKVDTDLNFEIFEDKTDLIPENKAFANGSPRSSDTREPASEKTTVGEGSVHSLDPKRRRSPLTDSNSTSIRKTSNVLEKFGVRMSRLDDFESKENSGEKSSAKPLLKKSSIGSSHSSVRNLSSYLDPRNDIRLTDYNKRSRKEIPPSRKLPPNLATPKTKSHKADVSVDESLISYDNSYSLHSAIQIPILTPKEEQFKISPLDQDKFADADSEQNAKFVSSQSNRSIIKTHRKVESATSQDSQLNKFVQQPFPTIRCSLLANSNYEMPPEDAHQRKRMTLTPEKTKKIETVFEEPTRVSVFDDPEVEQPLVVRDETTIFDDETAEKRRSSRPNPISLTRTKERKTAGSQVKARISSLISKRESAPIFQIENSPMDPDFKERELRERQTERFSVSPQKRPNWFKRLLGTIEKQVDSPHVRRQATRFKSTQFWKKQHIIETDVLSCEQVIEGLRVKLDHQNSIKLRAGRTSTTLNVEYVGDSRKNSLSVTVETERQDGYEYGFSGCVVRLMKNSGSTKMFKLSASMVEQIIRDLELTI